MCNSTLFRHFSIVDPEAIFYSMTRVEMAKDIHLQMWKCFAIGSGKLFDIWMGQIQSKLFYGLASLRVICLSIVFDWICPLQMAKYFPDKKATNFQILKLIWVRKIGFFLEKHCHQLLLHLKFRDKKCIDSTTKTNCTFCFTTIKVPRWNCENIVCITKFQWQKPHYSSCHQTLLHSCKV